MTCTHRLPLAAVIAWALGLVAAIGLRAEETKEVDAAPVSRSAAMVVDEDEDDDTGVTSTSFINSLWEQPPAITDPLIPSSSNLAPGRRYRGSRSSLLSSGSPINRLASSPNMFGDMTSTAGQMRYTNAGTTQLVDLPLAGGSRRLKVSENNKPIPMDRIYFNYSHFEGAINVQPNLINPSNSQALPIDRYIMGFEKTFFDGWSSVEVRMPLTLSLIHI